VRRRRRPIGVSDIAGRRTLITGAAGGIGRATAELAARRGAELFLTDIDAEGLERAVEGIRGAGGTVLHHRAIDITDRDAVVALAAEIHSGRQPMDVVMNVAGVSTWGTIDRLSHEDWRQMIEVNLVGPISILESFVPPMIEAGRGGHVANVSSAAGLFGLPWHAAYSASKFGLRGVSEVLRFDLRKHGIGVSLVCPGAVRTPLVDSAKIVGIDREGPRMRKMIERFERRGVSPLQVAERIVEGVERNRYMVFTSADIRVGYWVQRKFSPPYEIAMRAMNRELDRLAG
jgi:NAD(P)-dependent dehydrogenase (short-subunit alcohol dehydrogenase family)